MVGPRWLDAVWYINTGGRQIHFFRPSQINRRHMAKRMFLATVISRHPSTTEHTHSIDVGIVVWCLGGCGAVYMFCRDSTLFPSRNLTADVLIAKVRCRCCVLCPTRVEDMPFRYRFYSHLSGLNGSRSQVHDIWRSSGPVRNNYFHWGTPGCGFNFPSVYYSTNFRSGQICRRKCTSVVYA